MIWAGQSPDGRKWDENMPDGQPAMPWNGSSDTRVPVVDGVINDTVDLLTAAFRKAELRANTVNPDAQATVAGVSDYLHWLVHTKHRKALRLESELAAQYAQEYGFAIAYIGWEREIGKRRMDVKLSNLVKLAESREGAAKTRLGAALDARSGMLEVDAPSDDVAAAEAAAE